jgi:hypothetical protein
MSIALFKDESGRRYGRLTVVERAHVKRTFQERSGSTWRCMCDCGTELLARGQELRSKTIKECVKCNAAWGKKDD